MKERHFSLTEFVLYQLGRFPMRMAERLEAHVSEGCAACQRGLAFAQQLAGVTRRDREATPPAEVQQRARAMFRAVRQPEVRPLAGLAQVARLVFDSCLQPLPAGVRGALRLDRHLVFAERELLLDMHIEPLEDPAAQSITGQVQGKNVSQEQLSGLPVLLLEGGRVVMGTHTNRQGEFLFQSAPRREMTVCLLCPDRQVRIECPPSATTVD
ncbi:MAG: hypothetical protein NTZ98_00355 [Acidobacteria bacterium]|jgi:hypothetical protein|nr:hypothetical protein [Acidobacteriota bacterium]